MEDRNGRRRVPVRVCVCVSAPASVSLSVSLSLSLYLRLPVPVCAPGVGGAGGLLRVCVALRMMFCLCEEQKKPAALGCPTVSRTR